MELKVNKSWMQKLNHEFDKPYFVQLMGFVGEEYQSQQIYPAKNEILNAFEYCTFEATKVVIIGQDPYHGAGQANGLCFSVKPEVALPPSLVNIFKEIKNDLGKEIPLNGDLQRWAHQGVLMLNATLTVRASSPGSHQKKGWENFTNAVIKVLNEEKSGLVFILWGAYAQKKGGIIDKNRHLVLNSAHPSPFSAYKGFFGNKHFSITNQYLIANGGKAIDW